MNAPASPRRRKITPTLKAILYARFSPRPNAAECESVEKQLAELTAWCARHGYTVVASHEDKDLSGGDRERAGCFAALADVKRGYTLLVRDWTRLGRDSLFNLWLAEQCHSKGAELRSAAEGVFDDAGDPNTKLLSSIVSAIGEWHRAMGNIRTSAGMRRNQANGRLQSRIPPYGWREGPPKPGIDAQGRQRSIRTIEPDPAEQVVIREIIAYNATGATLRAIGRELTSRGITNRGGRWNHETIREILRRAGA